METIGNTRKGCKKNGRVKRTDDTPLAMRKSEKPLRHQKYFEEVIYKWQAAKE